MEMDLNYFSADVFCGRTLSSRPLISVGSFSSSFLLSLEGSKGEDVSTRLIGLVWWERWT